MFAQALGSTFSRSARRRDFVVAKNHDTARYKQFRRGSQLEKEGVVQLLRYPERGNQEPILADPRPKCVWGDRAPGCRQALCTHKRTADLRRF